MKVLRFGLLFMALFSITLAMDGKSAVGTLAGTVLDAGGKPAVNASITIQTSDGKRPHATWADAQGHFQFVRFESGQYDLRAYCAGAFSPWAKRVFIHSGETTQVTLHLAAPK